MVPLTMKAWRKQRGVHEAILDEIPVPEAPADGFLVKVLAAGVCHSDWALLQRDSTASHYQDRYTLGHEGCGEIVKIGSEVTDGRFKIGDLVAVHPVPGCHESDCPECSHGDPQICARGQHYGIGQDGSFAPYIAIQSRAAIPLPEGVSPAEGAVATDAVMTAYHAIVRRAEVKKHEVVVLFGLGGLGFNALQIVLSIGARVIVAEKREQILAEAVKFGVKEEDVVPVGLSVVEFVKENNIIVDTVVDFVGVQETISDAQQIVRPAGKIVGVGLLALEYQVNNLLCVQKKLSILYSYGGQKEDIEACLDLIAKKVVKPQVEEGELKDFPKIIHDLHKGKIRSRIALIPQHEK